MEKVAAVIFCIGALDYVFGNRLKLGRSFFEGFSTIPQLLMLMTGFMVLAPWIGSVAASAITPFFTVFGCDPSVLAGIMLSCDGGGAVLAERLASQPEAGLYNGMVLGTYMGCALTCSVPLSLANTTGDKRKAAVSGLLVAFVILPLACVITGMLCGFRMELILANTWPILVVSLILLVLFRLCGEGIVAVFDALALVIRAIALIGFSLAVVQEAFNWTILPEMAPLDRVFPVICRIGVFLAGMLPLLEWLRRIFGRAIIMVGQKLGLDQEETMGLILSLANSIPVLTSLERMSPKGIMLNTAFLTIASFAVGDHLAFALQYAPRTALPLMIGKIVCGGVTLALAVLAAPVLLPEGTAQRR